MPQVHRSRCVTAPLAIAALTCLLALSGAAVAASVAHAGVWMRVSCINPDQSPAPSEGWTSGAVGNVSLGSTNSTNCAPGTPMYAALAMPAPAGDGSSEYLAYTPPTGSTLVGGSLLVGLQANGYGFRAAATAAIFTPAYQYDFSNVFLQCVAILAACQNGLPEYYGVVNLPANRGGNLYLGAGCDGQLPQHVCSHGGSRGVWSAVAVGWANLLLSSDAQPTGADFRGSLLDATAHGSANLAFTAGDPGPGVYRVAVTIGTKEIYNATPNRNSGKCVAVGTDAASGALMFDHQQPCPPSQTIDIPVRTTTLVDGTHELKVTVTNAAQNVATVLRRTITVNNRTTISTSGTSGVDVVEADAPPGAKPVYAIILDPATQALLRGVRSAFAKSGLSLAGTLRNSAGVPAPGVPVKLIAQNAGDSASNVVASTTTDGAGHWVLNAPPGPSRKLTIVYGTQPTPEGGVTISQSVKPTLTLRVRALGRARLRFTGRLAIAPLGTPRPLVVIQARNGRRWQAVGSAVRVTPSGRFTLTYQGPRAKAPKGIVGGSYAFRAVAPSTQAFLTATSPIRRTRVR